jgi:hypothetical protein
MSSAQSGISGAKPSSIDRRPMAAPKWQPARDFGARTITSPVFGPIKHPTVPQTGTNSVAPKRRFPEVFQRDLPCPALPRKTFRLKRRANQNYKLGHLVPERGALAIVTNVGTGCGGRGSVGVSRYRRAGDPVSDVACARRRRQSVRQNRVVLAPVAGVKLAEARQPYRA